MRIITARPIEVEYRLISLVIIACTLFAAKEITYIFPRDMKGLMLFSIAFVGILALAHILVKLMTN